MQRLESIEPEIRASVATLEQAKTSLEKEFKRLLNARDQRTVLLAALQKEMESKGGQLVKLEKDRAELEKVLAAVREYVTHIALPAEYVAFSKQKGKLPWPAKGKLLRRFGEHRQGKLDWEGLFIGAKTGTPVKAVHHGRVVFADWLRGQGLLVIVDHGDGYLSLYGHNDMLLHEAGDWIAAGETIAQVGSSGGESSSGLYFEIRHKGSTVNPSSWLQRR